MHALYSTNAAAFLLQFDIYMENVACLFLFNLFLLFYIFPDCIIFVLDSGKANYYENPMHSKWETMFCPLNRVTKIATYNFPCVHISPEVFFRRRKLCNFIMII